MRSAIYLAAMMIADSVRPNFTASYTETVVKVLGTALVVFIVMDFVDLFKK